VKQLYCARAQTKAVLILPTTLANLFPLTFEPCDLFSACVWIMTIALMGLKIKVNVLRVSVQNVVGETLILNRTIFYLAICGRAPENSSNNDTANWAKSPLPKSKNCENIVYVQCTECPNENESMMFIIINIQNYGGIITLTILHKCIKCAEKNFFWQVFIYLQIERWGTGVVICLQQSVELSCLIVLLAAFA